MLNNVAPRIMAVIQAIIVMTRIVASPVKGISAIGMLPRTCDNLISLVVNRSTHLKSISCIRGDKSQIMGVYLKNNKADGSTLQVRHNTAPNAQQLQLLKAMEVKVNRDQRKGKMI